ncbi:hypothetical protein [Streptomyces sp. AM 2-1-1]|uniref:hypothetical protein n=1 Tax=Streptomyces sp. AM 2-1-1 TaxID=3028709 RepID=UPI0023B99A45|nr:hypothetical protein [Streptomyces sp. AM 2-1-1]WEH40821.1 hypothetical protein PZB77_15625 [Streptomyces sp. AM 2-1-1]
MSRRTIATLFASVLLSGVAVTGLTATASAEDASTATVEDVGWGTPPANPPAPTPSATPTTGTNDVGWG